MCQMFLSPCPEACPKACVCRHAAVSSWGAAPVRPPTPLRWGSPLRQSGSSRWTPYLQPQKFPVNWKCICDVGCHVIPQVHSHLRDIIDGNSSVWARVSFKDRWPALNTVWLFERYDIQRRLPYLPYYKPYLQLFVVKYFKEFGNSWFSSFTHS